MVTLNQVHLVLEFPYVFPKELPKLPPDGEIEFSIDVILGTQLISIPPYRMAGTKEIEGIAASVVRAVG